MRPRFTFGQFGGKFPWRPADDPERVRSRQFIVGTALSLVGTMFVLPIWVFLIHRPLLARAALVGGFLLALATVATLIGIAKLIACLRGGPFDHLTAMSFGVLLIVAVLIVNCAVFLFALRFQR